MVLQVSFTCSPSCTNRLSGWMLTSPGLAVGRGERKKQTHSQEWFHTTFNGDECIPRTVSTCGRACVCCVCRSVQHSWRPGCKSTLSISHVSTACITAPLSCKLLSCTSRDTLPTTILFLDMVQASSSKTSSCIFNIHTNPCKPFPSIFPTTWPFMVKMGSQKHLCPKPWLLVTFQYASNSPLRWGNECVGIMKSRQWTGLYSQATVSHWEYPVLQDVEKYPHLYRTPGRETLNQL